MEIRHGGAEDPYVPKALVSYPPGEQSYHDHSRSYLLPNCGADAPTLLDHSKRRPPDNISFLDTCHNFGESAFNFISDSGILIQRHSDPCIVLESRRQRFSHSILSTLPMLGGAYL